MERVFRVKVFQCLVLGEGGVKVKETKSVPGTQFLMHFFIAPVTVLLL